MDLSWPLLPPSFPLLHWLSLPFSLPRQPTTVFTRRSCGLLSDKFTIVAETMGLTTASGAAGVAPDIMGLVTDVLTEELRSGVDAGTTKQELIVVVAVTIAAGCSLKTNNGLGPSFMSSNSDGSNFRFLGNLHTSCTGCFSSLTAVKDDVKPPVPAAGAEPRLEFATPTLGRLTVAAGILELLLL